MRAEDSESKEQLVQMHAEQYPVSELPQPTFSSWPPLAR